MPADRLPRETRRAYQAFCDYLAIGPARSMRDLIARYRREVGTPPPTLHLSRISYWAEKWHWRNRCAAWDAENQRRQLEEAEADGLERLRFIREQKATLGRALVGKGGEGLQKLDPTAMRAPDVVRLIEAGLAQQMEAVGEAGRILEVRIRELLKLPREELLALAKSQFERLDEGESGDAGSDAGTGPEGP